MIVLDRTGSMSASNKMPQAKSGIMAFLSTMDPTVDNVGLAVLPPAPSAGAACTDVKPWFNSTRSGTYSLTGAAYTVVPLSNTYATTTGNLVSSSPLVSTVNCVQPGGNTAYAEALDAAYKELAADPSSFSDVPTPASLTGIFQRIAADIAGGSSRIVE